MKKGQVLLLEKAIDIALKAHTGQIDKAGAPYILHPLRVMLQMESEVEKIIAVLHDVIEDGRDRGFTFDYLRKAGFPEEIIETLKVLTHDKSEPYELYIKKIALNPVARRVKMVDLRDNMRIDRISHPTEKDYARIEKYKRALNILRT
jgi:(p)ppGpp synthase/HD superfamily hydrolase